MFDAKILEKYVRNMALCKHICFKKPAMVDTSTTPEDINNMFPHGVVTHLLPSGTVYILEQ